MTYKPKLNFPDIIINLQQLCPLTELNWYDNITIDRYTKTENPWYLTGIRDWGSYLNSKPQTSSSAPSDPPGTAVLCQIPQTRNPLIPSQRRWSGSPIPPRKAPSPTKKHSDSVILTYTVYQVFPHASIFWYVHENAFTSWQSCKSGILKILFGFREIFTCVDLIHGFGVEFVGKKWRLNNLMYGSTWSITIITKGGSRTDVSSTRPRCLNFCGVWFWNSWIHHWSQLLITPNRHYSSVVLTHLYTLHVPGTIIIKNFKCKCNRHVRP